MLLRSGDAAILCGSLRYAPLAANASGGSPQQRQRGPDLCRRVRPSSAAAGSTRGTAVAGEQQDAAQPSSSGRPSEFNGNGSSSSGGNGTAHAGTAASGRQVAAHSPPGLRSQIDTQQRGRSRASASPAARGRSSSSGGRGSGTAAAKGRPRSPAPAQLQRKPPRLERSMDDEATMDPLALPDMPHYQPWREPGSVGRSDLLSAITAAQRWEDVAAVVDNRELDAIGLAAAFGHLAKLHAMAGPDSTMPRQLIANGLVERLTERAAALAATRARFPGRNVAAVLAAFPKLGAHPDESHLLSLSGAASRALTTFAPGHAANAVRAFGALRFEPPGTLLTDLAAAAASRPGKLSPYNVGSLAWGCARLGVHPGERTLQALERRIEAAAGDFKAAHVAETLWGFGTLRHVPSQHTVAVLLQRVVESEGLPPPFGFRSIAAATALSGIAKLGITQPGGAADAAATRQRASSSGSVSGNGIGAGSAGGNGSGAVSSPPGSSQPQDGPLASTAAASSGGSWPSTDAATAAAGDPVGQAIRVLAAALAAGVDDLNASQLAQALSALAQLPSAAVNAARRPLLAAVASTASSFPPPTVCKALTALEALAAVPAERKSEGSARSRLAAMQTVEDHSSSDGSGDDDEADDSAALQRFVGSLSSAQQALEDAQMAADGGSDSSEDEPQFLRSSDETDLVEAFPLDSDFLLPPGGGDPAAAEDPEAPAAAAAAAAAAGGEAATALTALARQVRLTARRFDPAMMLAALRSFAALAAPAAGADPSTAASAVAAAPAFVLPADVVDALAGDIAARHLQFTKLQRSEAASLLGRLAAARGVSMASVQALARTAQL